MKPILIILLLVISISFISCSVKDKKSPSSSSSDSTVNNGQMSIDSADSTLAPIKQFFENELSNWAQSFKGFSIDSFRMTQNSDFEKIDAGGNDMNKFYALYKASLSYSTDSSQFIDLYSSGIMLEKKGKKIIASSDADQAVTLCNLKSNEWKRIAFFGPSAGIEEAVWTSPSTFILAGSMYNDNGEQTPYIMLGDTNSQSFRWFEASIIRPESSKYEASGIKKLKIDEWE